MFRMSSPSLHQKSEPVKKNSLMKGLIAKVNESPDSTLIHELMTKVEFVVRASGISALKCWQVSMNTADVKREQRADDLTLRPNRVLDLRYLKLAAREPPAVCFSPIHVPRFEWSIVPPRGRRYAGQGYGVDVGVGTMWSSSLSVLLSYACVN